MQVALVRCTDYELVHVEAALRHSLELIGGLGAIVRPGQRVLLKPNLLRAMSPTRAATTHPAVVAAVARLVQECGGQPILVESPGGPYAPRLLQILYRITEMTWAAEQSGLTLNTDTAATSVSYPDGRILKRLDVVQPLLEADVVINLPKLKTHNLVGLTLGVKNLFGLVPGATKIGYHSKLQDRARFADGLLDIYGYVHPALTIMDAVVGMEGLGPSGGDARPIGALLAGTDALAVDIVAAALVGVEPTRVLTTHRAVTHGLTSGRVEDIEVLGDALDALRLTDFRLGMDAPVDPGLMRGPLRWLLQAEAPRGRGPIRRAINWVGRQTVATPYAGPDCIGCGFCARHCPVEAITIVNRVAQMNLDKCIRCYCCHELCPETAVLLRRPWLGRTLMGK